MATMVDMVSEPSTDPDAQATVTDFLDYTEYLPSDIIRSLTLLRGLDETFFNNAHAVHEHTRQYGALPKLPAASRPDPQTLRSSISTHLDQALSARQASHAEAIRLFDVADRHHNRLSSIVNKLRALPKPPSRDPTPAPASPETKRSRSGRKLDDGTSTQRLTLNPPRVPGIPPHLVEKSRNRRVTIPGDVLPPFNPDSPIASTEQSDWETEPGSPTRPAPSKPRKRPASPNSKKIKIPKVPRMPRETTAPYKMPTPPPEDAKIGGEHKPWIRLTDWEMWKLRKKMKKNINWEPSEIMIQRELAEKGRGWDNYYKVKAEAQANGAEFADVDNLDKSRENGELVGKGDTPSVDVAAVRNRGMKLNEAKKLKREALAREQAALAAAEAEAAARRLGDIGSAFKNLFSPLGSALANLNGSIGSPIANGTKSIGKKPSRKRKLDETNTALSPSAETSTSPKKKPKPGPKPTPLPKPPQLAGHPSLSSQRPRHPLFLALHHATPRGIHSNPILSPQQSLLAHRAAHPHPPTSRPLHLPIQHPKRTKREAPGQITQSSADGGAAVSISKRKNKPGPKPRGTSTSNTSAAAAAGSSSTTDHNKSDAPQIRVDIDGNKEVIDPDEERFCVCGDVSWGEMICCEMDEKCEDGQWFHLGCVGMVELPARTVKWYSPACRKKYKKGVDTNGLVGRMVK
ncbi:hypothetical protein EPUS_05005 [Endocarpon pusillum Z07020]|uniref:Inhibitor of growth protein N-terminal histone-binding domain-containing protein n=1 Tax=Endocarpon pusillum (strain Z07020 / HMAS-L-300199) TaxID=1263415 RepID=U1G457_ENDPU|nr:uncharacterized protein EPUS_05005 [Endocarpon pusillum Z07020]ERF72087.1 hypothetical protein EPUS_05005 [Endocarpon pusillum Z07020]